MRYWTTLCAAAALGLAGCNQPAVSLKAPALQSSENTVRDWNDVAQTIATGMAAAGLLPSPTQPAPAAGPTPAPVFVRMMAPDSAFVRQVATQLEADVMQMGGTVARSPEGATVVNVDVNFVAWGPRDKPPGLVGTTAAILSTPAIVLGATGTMATWTAANAAAAGVAGVGPLTDALIALTPTMNAEAIWEATVITSDRVVMRLQEPVYIRDHDIPLYVKHASLSPIASWSSSSPLRARTVRYDP
jgi:hypothetical protein